MSRMELLEHPLRIQIAGRDWFLSPLTIADRAAIAAELTSRRINAILNKPDGTPRIETHRLENAALGEAVAKAAIAPVTYEDMLQTIDGQLLTLFFSLRNKHKELTLKNVQELPATDVAILTRIVSAINSMDDEESETGPDPTNSTAGDGRAETTDPWKASSPPSVGTTR